MKQGKSGGSVGTTHQGNGKARNGVSPMGTAAYGGKDQGKGKGRGEGRLPAQQSQREVKGRDEEEGHRVVSSRLAPPPMEGRGPREGQRISISR